MFDVSFRTIDYVIISHQALLSKTTKHWDSFVSHCMYANILQYLEHSKYLVSSKKLKVSRIDFYLLSPSLRLFDLAGGQWPQALPVVVAALDSMGRPC